MRRKIKFRGRDLDTNEYVYATIGQIAEEIQPGYLMFITDDTYIVDKATLAQLIAVDENGREVYEGDKVISKFFLDDDGKPEQLSLFGQHVLKRNPHCEKIYEATFSDFDAILDGDVILWAEENDD